MITLNQLLQSYKEFLKVQSNYRCKRFMDLEQNNPESARAEAVVYNFLISNRISVQHYEKPDYGGADFICMYLNNKFIVEVTCIESETISKRSGIPNIIPEKIEAHSFSYITSLLRGKTSDKADQLANEQYPRILAITCEHIATDILFSNTAIENFITSDTKIRVTINDQLTNHQDVTDLSNSVFFRFNNKGSIEACRQSISAILLIEINNDSCRVYGLLHPEPVYKFHHELLPRVPFLRINPWPIKNNRIYTEWVIDDPNPYINYYNEFIT